MLVPSALSDHAVHSVLVTLGLTVLVVLLHPAAQRAPHARAAAQLRRHAREGRLLELAQSRAQAPTRRDSWVSVAVVAAVASGWIHALVVGEHAAVSAPLGALFTAVAVAQTAWAVAVLRRPTSRLLAVGAWGNALVVALWLLSRTAGLPGLGVESVGLLDVLATSYEIAVVGACAAARRSGPASVTVPTARQRRGIAVAAGGTLLLVVAGL